MPLLRPPDLQVPKRKFTCASRNRLPSHSTATLNLLARRGIDHVVNQASEFVFRKDSDFKEWLSQNPLPAPRRILSRRKKARSALNSTPRERGPNKPEPGEATRP